MMKSKKALIVILIAIVILAIRRQYMVGNTSLANYVVFIFNSFSIDDLIDVFSIVIYSLPITLWVIVAAFNINSYYENYIFLVTRLGGQREFNKKLFSKAFRESTFLVISTYLVLIIFLIITGHAIAGDISIIILSLLLNYTVVIMLLIIFMIFRIYHYFSLSFALTYLIEISLLVIGLFLKYMKSDIVLIKNPMMNTIMFFYHETKKIVAIDYAEKLVLNFTLIVILIIIYNYLLWRRREIND